MPIYSSLYGTRLDRELGSEDSTVLFTTARRKAAINEAQEEFAQLTECLARQSTVTIAGGTGEYNLNSTSVIADGDFLRFSVEQVQFRYTDSNGDATVRAGDDLVRRDVEWLNRYEPGWNTPSTVSGQQLPSYYYLRPDGGALYLGFYPMPSTGSSASASAVVPYLARPAVMTSDTSEPFTVGGAVRADRVQASHRRVRARTGQLRLRCRTASRQEIASRNVHRADSSATWLLLRVQTRIPRPTSKRRLSETQQIGRLLNMWS
jgi:hypothetical protein